MECEWRVCVSSTDALVTSSSDRDCRTDRLPMFSVYYLTQVAQIHRESTVRLPGHSVIRRPRNALSRCLQCTYHLCRLSVTMNSVCYSLMKFAISGHSAVIVNTDMSLEASGLAWTSVAIYTDVYASGHGFYGSVAK